MNPAVRRRVLAEWRGNYEPPAEKPALAAGDLMPEAMRALGLSDLVEESRVTAAWREIAGDFIATHAVPASLKKGVLVIQLLNTSLRFELERAGRHELLPRLQEKFGKRTIRKIEFRIG